MKYLLILLTPLLFSSCAAIFFKNIDKNTTFRVRTNVPNVIVKTTSDDFSTKNGKVEITLPKLSSKYQKILVESDNYESQKIRIKKNPRILPLVLDIISIPFTL